MSDINFLLRVQSYILQKMTTSWVLFKIEMKIGGCVRKYEISKDLSNIDLYGLRK